jgi:hypothetical protein
MFESVRILWGQVVVKRTQEEELKNPEPRIQEWKQEDGSKSRRRLPDLQLVEAQGAEFHG